MRFGTVGLLTGLFALFASGALSEVLITCNEPKGHLYVDGTGWVEDGYTGGSFQLVSAGDEYDIFWTDAIGTRSAKAEGAIVIATEITDEAITVVAAHPRSLETFLFDFSGKQMITTKLKISTPQKIGGSYYAKCE